MPTFTSETPPGPEQAHPPTNASLLVKAGSDVQRAEAHTQGAAQPKPGRSDGGAGGAGGGSLLADALQKSLLFSAALFSAARAAAPSAPRSRPSRPPFK